MVGRPALWSRAVALVAGVLILATVAVAPAGPARAAGSTHRSATTSVRRVVVVGVPGLRWSDVTQEVTPTLWGLAGSSSLGAMSVRAEPSNTRRGDGWLTLGSGDRARAFPSGTDPAVAAEQLPDPADPPAVRALVELNRRSSFGAHVGALGAAVHAAGLRTAASGAGAGLAAMDAGGSVDEQLPPATAASGLVQGSPASLVVVELPEAYAQQPGPLRDAALREVDARLGRLRAATGPGDLLLVLGVSDRVVGASQLTVALVHGPGFERRWLASTSTRHQPIVQLVDVAPTVLTALGAPVPSDMIGGTWSSAGPVVATSRTGASVSALDRLTARTFAQSRLGSWFPRVFGWAGVALAALAAAYLWAGRRRPWVGPFACAVAAVPLATWLVQLLPWWRWDTSVVAALVLVLAAATGLPAALGPWRRWRWGPAGAVGLLSAGVLAVDVMSGSRLQLDAPFGDNPVVAGRFHGIGNGAFAVLGAGALVAGVAFGSRSTRGRAAIIALGTGLAAVLVDGLPSSGDDIGGVLALLPAVLVLAVLVAEARVRAGRVLAVAGVTALAVVALAAYDYSLPPSRRSHLGRFVQQLRDGSAGAVVHRKMVAAERTLLSGSFRWTVLAVLLLAAAAWLLHRRGRVTVVTGEERRLLAFLVSVAVLGLLGGFLNDSGLAVTAIAWWLAAPLAVLMLVPQPARVDRDGPVPAADSLSSGR